MYLTYLVYLVWRGSAKEFLGEEFFRRFKAKRYTRYTF